MAVMTVSYVSKIGETAGLVWQALAEHGPMSLAKLVRQVKAPKDHVLHAIGWLAREDKIQIEDRGRSKTISLT